MLPERKIFESIRHDPPEVLKAIWSELGAGARQSLHPWHLGILATAAEQGPCVRTVVLRVCGSEERWIACHADRRSPKVKQLQSDGRTEWLFYHPLEKVQVRLWGRSTVHGEDELAESRWRSSSLSSRRCYLAPYPQGSVLEEPLANLPPTLQQKAPKLEESELGREHFCVIKTTIETIDWYYLHALGHLRLGFSWEGGILKHQWLAA